jgi:hypothetical protein
MSPKDRQMSAEALRSALERLEHDADENLAKTRKKSEAIRSHLKPVELTVRMARAAGGKG